MTQHAVIVGGGYTGTCTAIQLSRQARQPLRISIVEQRDAVGQGLAYSSPDPDHRLNAPDMVHFVTPDDPDQLCRWYEEQGGAAFDAAAEVGDGVLHIRRGDFGRFLGQQFAVYQSNNPSGSSLVHVRDRALDICKQGNRFRISLESSRTLEAGLVVIATSNERPAIPAAFAGPIAEHPSFFANPWDLPKIEAIQANARLLFVGTALTATDLIVTRLRKKHTGKITAMSRRGLRSTSRPKSGGGMTGPFWNRISRKTSFFMAKHGPQSRLLDLIRLVRADIAEAEARGEPWQSAFDELRDSVWQVWPALPAAEKRRYMRHLRPWYDVHRFRLPPQIETTLESAMASGQLDYKAAQILSVENDRVGLAVTYRPRNTNKHVTETFDAIINCTGPEPRPDRTTNPFMRALVERGLARPHPVGVGFDVDDDCAAIGADGESDPRLRIFGPLTIGQFGDPQGTPFILRHICRTMPQIVDLLEKG